MEWHIFKTTWKCSPVELRTKWPVVEHRLPYWRTSWVLNISQRATGTEKLPYGVTIWTISLFFCVYFVIGRLIVQQSTVSWCHIINVWDITQNTNRAHCWGYVIVGCWGCDYYCGVGKNMKSQEEEVLQG